MPELHRIRRLGWRVRARSRDEAFALRQRLRGPLGSSLVETVGAAFDRAMPGGAVVRLARLEVRVRVKSLEQLDEALAAGTVEALLAQVAARAQPARGSGTTASGGVEAVPSGRDGLSQWIETGMLPWYAGGGDRPEALARLKDAARESWREVVARMSSAPGAPAWVRFFRLLRLLPEAEWPRVAEYVARQAPTRTGAIDWPALMSSLTAGARPRADYPRQRLAAAVLAAANEDAPARTAADLERILGLDGARDGDSQTGFAADEARAWCEAAWRGSARPAAAAHAPGIGMGIATRADGLPVPRAGAGPAGTPAGAVDAAPFALPVSHAGLVLLVPFLPRFLESTGIAPAGTTALPTVALPRAAALLALVATGNPEVEEFDLGFIKVLLGLEPESPLPLAAGLTDAADRDEADALLDAVIGYWPALKRTSIEGLRTAFLARPGLLHNDDLGWRLRVEPQTYDVLIDQLPWAIGTTTLPWLTRPILTDWPTR